MANKRGPTIEIPAQVDVVGKPVAPNQARANLAFIEFDDQGDFFDRTQLEDVVRRIGQTRRQSILVVFIHGWQNRAIIHGEYDRYDVQKGDVQRFKRFLVTLANTPSILKTKRRVEGVFIGWRGEMVRETGDNFVTNLPAVIPRGLSYFSRRAAASRMGDSSALGETIVALREAAGLERYVAGGAVPVPIGQRAATIFMAHSFGAKVLDGALAQFVARRAGQLAAAANYRAGGVEIPRMADLVLLLNPAGESLYAKRICDRLENLSAAEFARSNPAVVSLTSEGDWLTLGLMPAVGTVSGAFAEYRGPERPYLNGIGSASGASTWQAEYYPGSPPSNPRLYNTRVTLVEESKAEPRALTLQEEFRAAVSNLEQNLSASGDSSIRTVRGAIFALDRSPAQAPLCLNRTAYWAMRVDRRLMDGHGDIWSANATALYARLFRLAVPEAFRGAAGDGNARKTLRTILPPRAGPAALPRSR